jgi:hypothetical protein
MAVIDTKAESIVSRMGVTSKQGLATFDPATIMAILSAVGSVIVQVIQAVSNCGNPTPTPPAPAQVDGKKKAAVPVASGPMAIVNSPGLLQRMKLNVMCRASLIRAGVPMKYQYLANDMKDSMIAEGQTTTMDDWNQMTAEAAGLGNQDNPWSF